MTLTVAIAVPPGALRSQDIIALSQAIQRHASHCHLDWQVVIQPDLHTDSWLQFMVERHRSSLACIGMVHRADGFLPATVPLVTLVQVEPQSELTTSITLDDDAVGQLAAISLIRAGYRRLLCLEHTNKFSTQAARNRAFLIRARLALPEESVSCLDWSQNKSIKALPALIGSSGPVGIFIYQDRPALHFLEECRLLGVRIPDQVGIIGVDDAETCGHVKPSLSSIQIPIEAMIGQAVLALHRMVSNPQAPAPEPLRLAPIQAVMRDSTALKAIPTTTASSGLAQQFLALVSTCADQRTTSVTTLAQRLGCSPRWLQTCCLRQVGQSPLEILVGERMSRARQRLATPASLSDIASASGFANASSFSHAFTRKHGLAPHLWRQLTEKNPPLLSASG